MRGSGAHPRPTDRNFDAGRKCTRRLGRKSRFRRREKQEGNGPLDSRAKVIISDKIFGLVYLKSETVKLHMHVEFLKVKFLKNSTVFSYPTTLYCINNVISASIH